MTHVMPLLIAVVFDLGHHPVTFTVRSKRSLSFTLKSPLINSRKHVPHALIYRVPSPYISFSKLWLSTAIFFSLNKKSNAVLQMFFSGKKLGMITKRLKRDVSSWETKVVCLVKRKIDVCEKFILYIIVANVLS